VIKATIEAGSKVGAILKFSPNGVQRAYCIDMYEQDYQNARKIVVLASADLARLTHFIIPKRITSERPSLSADAAFCLGFLWLGVTNTDEIGQSERGQLDLGYRPLQHSNI
jgi:hypothetical protein